ncbi:50S ribosomal protein L11 methyltransferase [Deinococcus phoenicis]|uniref:Ribosomal protein L11 methyltransferase n=1 Tax=Deinococcus phoenicis TaxID=1476583 RepID=A0A016QQH7_9DEIO|nr:50S ribosomal protein L11 methyltransferase [Deinococcus phoenicis]EYB68338.1 50S ribosomal protein L11 methyltransferase [Deinococcus phoenicis]
MLVYHLPGTLDTREADLDLLWGAGATGLEERAGVIRAYFDARTDLPAPVSDGEWREETDQDWQAEFKRTLRPVRAGRVTIIPPWLREEVEAGQLPLVIEPGMAFGTGHHATTRLAVEALSDLNLATLGLDGTGARVLDVGTGSGVLAIAAALLGARFAFGVDIDPITIPIARENAAENGVPAERVRFEEGTLGADPLNFPEGGPEEEPEEETDAYDVLVANLYAELHDLLAGEYAAHLIPGGPLVLTGILTVKLPLVRAALARERFGDVRETLDGEWALVTARAPLD